MNACWSHPSSFILHPSSLLYDSAAAARQHFFPVLICTAPLRFNAEIAITGYCGSECDYAFDGIAGKYGAVKTEGHLSRDQVQVATNFRRQSCGQKTMSHQPSLRI